MATDSCQEQRQTTDAEVRNSEPLKWRSTYIAKGFLFRFYHFLLAFDLDPLNNYLLQKYSSDAIAHVLPLRTCTKVKRVPLRLVLDACEFVSFLHDKYKTNVFHETYTSPLFTLEVDSLEILINDIKDYLK